MIEARRLECQSAEHAIESKEPNPKVLVHQSVIVQGMVMEIVQSSRPHKPKAKERSTLHPKVLDVHPVMQITKHQKTPRQYSPNRDRLIGQRDPEQAESGNGNG
jgi:hypothetical protein